MLEALVGISCDACIRSDKKFTTHIAFKYYIKSMRKEKGNERSQGKLKNFKIFFDKLNTVLVTVKMYYLRMCCAVRIRNYICDVTYLQCINRIMSIRHKARAGV